MKEAKKRELDVEQMTEDESSSSSKQQRGRRAAENQESLAIGGLAVYGRSLG